MHGKGNEKQLLIILGFMIIVILGLVAILIVHNLPKPDNTVTQNEPIEEEIINEEELKKWEEDGDAIEAQIDKAVNESQALLNEDLSNSEKVFDKFNAVINLAIERDRNDYIMLIIDARDALLLSFGLKDKIIQFSKMDDLSRSSDPDKYRAYTKIIDFAEEIGDEATVSEYTKKREEVADGYWYDYNTTKENAEATRREESTIQK